MKWNQHFWNFFHCSSKWQARNVLSFIRWCRRVKYQSLLQRSKHGRNKCQNIKTLTFTTFITCLDYTYQLINSIFITKRFMYIILKNKTVTFTARTRFMAQYNYSLSAQTFLSANMWWPNFTLVLFSNRKIAIHWKCGK